MKVYFTCSARGTEELGNNYKLIFDQLSKLGFTHLDDYREQSNPVEVYAADDNQREEIYKKAMKCLQLSDVVVLEVSVHSLSMGYIMHKALDMGKPVIALHTAGNEPVFAAAVDDDKLLVVEYSTETVEEVLKSALDYAIDRQDTRFNFFISPKHQNYLDWVSKTKKVPRAVFLRNLIEQEMDKDEEFKV